MRSLMLSLMVLAACGADADESEVGDGGINDAPDGSTGNPLIDAGPTELPVLFSIQFDYRFDTSGFFADVSRRETLEEAAKSWGRVFSDDFPTIPAGTTVRTRDPESPQAAGMNLTIDTDIDDLLVFVGCSTIDGESGITAMSNHSAAINSVADSTLRNALNQRYRGADFQPWTGWISFDCDEDFFFDASPETDDDIPGVMSDFFSVAMHELGHVMGVGTADAFEALRQGPPMVFVGSEAVAAHGGNVPLTPNGVHLDSSVVSDGHATLFDSSHPGGARTAPTSLDIALLLDLGYQRP